jgi:hypothetical protein
LRELDSQIWSRVGVVDSDDHQLGVIRRCHLGQVRSFFAASP